MGSAAPSLVCIGNVTIDEAVRPDGERSTAAGGDALFAALAARAHLDRVSWLAPVGADMPEVVLDAIRAAGLTAAAPGRRAEPTVRNVITYRADGTRSWHLVHGQDHFEAMSVHPGDVTGEVLASDGILVSGMAPEAQLALVPWLRAHSDAAIYLDLQEDDIAGREEAWNEVVGCCDVFLPSEVEAVALAGTGDLERAMASFRGLGPGVVVVKRAERGCLVLETGAPAPVVVPAEPVEALDATGAGDAFCGAFAAVHLTGAGALAAAHAGSAAARRAIGAPGFLGLMAAA